MPRRYLRLLVPALVLVAAGCAQAAPNTPAVNVPSASAAPSQAPTRPAGQTSDRGNLIKQVGETAGFGPGQDDIEVTFVVDKISVDAKCTADYAQKPEHGHFVRLDLRAETKPTMPTDRGYSIGPFDFSTVGGDGITEQNLGTGPAYTCIDPSEQLPPNIAPGSKYRGAIVLDTKNPSGVLVYRPGFMASGGWEWTYGK